MAAVGKAVPLPPIKSMSIDERLMLILKAQEELARNVQNLYEVVFRLEQTVRLQFHGPE